MIYDHLWALRLRFKIFKIAITVTHIQQPSQLKRKREKVFLQKLGTMPGDLMVSTNEDKKALTPQKLLVPTS